MTGHTGFKGSWLLMWLAELGAEVTGLSLPPEAPSLFDDLGLARACRHVEVDVRDYSAVAREVTAARPEVVFHLAAQALVRRGYADPAATFTTNVLGTTHVLEALRAVGPRAIVVVTSDKCYAPRQGGRPHVETDPLGGDDPYSASKAACEHVAAAYRFSFFSAAGCLLATVRAGNVIGGGDWSMDRLVPDAMRALIAREPVAVRNGAWVRPWQHVIEPLAGYLTVGAHLLREERAAATAWNFGPRGAATVRELIELVIACWGSGSWRDASDPAAPPETPALRLDVEKAGRELGWRPRWDLPAAIERTVAWYRARNDLADAASLRRLCVRHIAEYLEATG